MLPAFHTVTTADLKAGDIVRAEGCRFRLTTVSSYEDRGETVYAWRTEVVDASNWTGPKHWLKDWIVQGNRFAYWRREA